jgi:ATP-dependent Lon protease
MMDILSEKLTRVFPGKVVRKDLTKKIKEGANVPVYVLEYLLGMYCASSEEREINDGIQRVKDILAENFVRPDEAEKVKSKIRELKSYTVIDKITVKLNEKQDRYEAEFSNLGIKDAQIDSKTVQNYEKLLVGGIWSIVKVHYFFDEENKKSKPFYIANLTPIQMPNMDLDILFTGRKNFSKEQWIDVLMRSIGMEPTKLENKAKWHLLERCVPLAENNYNLCELGPRGTGKSHIYKEISPNSILVSGGQTTVANYFFIYAYKRVAFYICINIF